MVGNDVKSKQQIDWCWVILFGSFVRQTIGGGLEHAKGILYIKLIDRYQANAIATSWVLTLSSSVGFLTGPLLSRLCDKLCFRKVAIIGAVMVSLGLMTSGFAPNIAVLYLTYGVCTGLGRIFVLTSGSIVIGTYFKKRLGLAVGLSSIGNGVGSFIFPLAIEFLFSTYDFLWTMLLLSAMSMHFFITAFTLPTSKNNKDITVTNKNNVNESCTGNIHSETATNVDQNSPTEVSGTSKSHVNNDNDRKTRPSSLQLHLWKNYFFIVTCIQFFFHHFAKQVSNMFLPAYVISRGLSVKQAAIIMSVSGICESVSKIMLTILLDFEHMRKYRLYINSVVIIAMGLVLYFVPSLTSFEQIISLYALYGLLCGTRSQKTIMIVDIFGPDYLAASLGWVLLFQGLGSVTGPTIAALLKDKIGDYGVAIYLGATGHLIGGFLMITGNIWMFCRSFTYKFGTIDDKFRASESA